MNPISDAQLTKAALILGAKDALSDAIEAEVHALLADAMSARRVIDWLPEAFALVLIPYVAPVELPATFSARDRKGRWKTFPMHAEPMLRDAVRLGMDMYHHGSREIFTNIVCRSALLAVVNQALSEMGDIAGGALSGPALVGVPAEIYSPPPGSLWNRLFRSAGSSPG